MAEYIDKQAFIDYMMGTSRYFTVKYDIESFPNADVAPVRHGRWISVPHKLARICSVCNRDEPYKFADIDADVYDYCPHCGAKMDEKENDNG